MADHRLRPLLKPASIAVLGASNTVGSVGNEVFVNLRKGGFAGVIYPVNPSYTEVQGLPCYASLSELPQTPEHVIFAIGDQRVEAALDEVISLGIQACTIFSALILNDDSAPRLKQRVQAKVDSAGLMVAGANGMGFYNIRDQVLAGGFDTRDHRPPGNVTLISQSGAGMSGIVDCEQRIDFNFAVSSGYELSVSMEDYLDYALDLPETRVVGLFLETSRQPQKLIAAFKKASARKIPIVVLKVGRTELSAQMAMSHSGALAGSYASYAALFDHYGVQRVDDMDQLATALIMFAQPNATAAGGIACLHDSGGERQLLIDLADQHSVPLAQLGKQTLQTLQGLLDPGLPAVNPLDGWGAGGADAPANMATCFTRLLEDNDAALGAVIHDRGPNGEVYQSYMAYLHQAQAATNKPVFLVANRQGSGSDDLAISSTHKGFPVIDGVSQFLVGARCLLGYRDFHQRQTMELAALDPEKVAHWREHLCAQEQITEVVASQCLADFGIPMVLGVQVENQAELIQAAGKLTYPLVVKTAQPDITHKSDQAGVRLNIQSESSLIEAYQDLRQRLGKAAMVAPMVESGGIEMILGIASDDQFGPVVVLGFGGIYAEVLADTSVLLPPFDKATALRTIEQLKMSPLLKGARGLPKVDIDAYGEAAARLSVFAAEFGDLIREVDINPIKIMPKGCIGMDALMVPRGSG
ncbi:MAG: acetate--CoA ligase family protein [Porticoccaceae bacterium]|jgi:acetate---CoA ligase (ADP-forming)|nr:acetate--CoA ligase family protein [Porticoccaceae bacterium]